MAGAHITGPCRVKWIAADPDVGPSVDPAEGPDLGVARRVLGYRRERERDAEDVLLLIYTKTLTPERAVTLLPASERDRLRGHAAPGAGAPHRQRNRRRDRTTEGVFL